ncbi:MAG TPA: hypothetical protein ENN77_02950 [Candidatus Wirthbacteria bacterium]|nr:hypothetical protein [Candidatus Wirthbacteria bacterium]
MKKTFFIGALILPVVFGVACTTQTQDQTSNTDNSIRSTDEASKPTELPNLEATVDNLTNSPWSGMSLGEIEAASEILTAIKFCTYLADGQYDEAVALMDADPSTKQAWKNNFATLQSLEIKRTGPVRVEEWTATRQIFKTVLTVSVSPEGEQMDWMNGENERWISLQKNNGVWQVHEFANNR